MESLLVNLRKYRPRENTDPLENFITEAFAWLLQSNRDVLDGLLKLINEKLNLPVILPNDEVHVSTQENFANKFPDLVISWKGCVFVFEHKVNSSLSPNQLRNYRDYISDNSDDYRIILITATPFQHAQNPDTALCWQDIYNCFKNLAESISDEQASWAIDEFLSLLKSEGLGPVTPINRFSITNYLEAVKFIEQVHSVFKAAQKRAWPLKTIGMQPVFKRQGTECRIGLEFCPEVEGKGRQWLPAIFCGVLLDGSDHGAKEFINNELKLCLVFDFNRDGQDIIKNSANYTNFKASCKKSIVDTLADWEFLDTAFEPKAKFNAWHPIVILTPMLPVFEHTSSHEDQVNKVIETFTALQSMLIDQPNFIKLVEELTVKKA
jgi:hypothetical protein